MSGPNSAPNGNGGLVKGYSREEWVEVKKVVGGKEIVVLVSLRDFLARKNRLVTGKTGR